MQTPIRAACAALLALCALAAPAAGQSLLDRSPNLNGAWVGNSGQMYFNFMHRFVTSDAPLRKVSNFPTFTVAAGLPLRTLVGFHYSTNSTLAPSYPNEWEFFLRHALIQQDRGAPVDFGGMVAYNLSAEGVDGEVTMARRQGPVRLIAAARILSNPYTAGETRFALAGGGTLRISRYFAVAGDVATLLNRAEGEGGPDARDLAWSAALHLALPHTPHTLSLQATNTNVYSLQGASRGESQVRYGFEFTIPITLSRWFGGGGGGAAPAALPPPATAATPSAEPPAGGRVVKAGMRSLAYTPARIEIEAGTTVEWTNNDPLAHTVTALDKSFDSGLIESGRTWRHTFTAPGTYDFNCTPHPFMKGVVIVK